MEENTFWISLWRTVAAVVCVLIVSVGGCTAYESKRIADAIDKGVDPMDARCALGNIQTACLLRAQRP